MPFHTSQVGFSLSSKLIFGYLLVTIPALSVMAAISLFAIRDLTSFNRQLQEISRSLAAAEELESAVASLATPLSAYVVNGRLEEGERFQASIHEVEARLKGCSAASCHEKSWPPGVMTEALIPVIQGIRARGAAVFGIDKALTDKARSRVTYEIIQQSQVVHSQVSRMSSSLLLRVAALQDESQSVSQRAATLILVSVVLVLALTTLVVYFLSQRLLRHIRELLAGTRHVMQGDLAYRVAVTVPDEIGELAQSFNIMTQQIGQHREHLQAIVEAKTVQLRQTQDSLIQSEKLASIGLLASGVAHELNNPLTSILMNVNLLMEDVAEQPALQQELQRISEDTIRCKRIIDDLRDFSRRHDLGLVPSDLNRLVENGVRMISRHAGFGRIMVVREFCPDLPEVPCDPARMEQVLVNVLVNALQAMPEGGSLSLRTGLGLDFAEISIQDTGPGIPDKIRSRIFDPFFTTKPQGTGLGLSIVYRIMEAHGGRVELESVTQEHVQDDGTMRQAGTRVILYLPLKAKNADIETAAVH